MENLKIDFIRLFRYTLTILIITMVCQLVDFYMFFYDHRFLLGVVMGGIFMSPVYNLLGRLSIFRGS